MTAEERAPVSEPDELALLEEEVVGLRRLIEDHVAVCPTAGGEGQDPAVPALQRAYGYLRLAMAEFRVLEAHLDPSGTGRSAIGSHPALSAGLATPGGLCAIRSAGPATGPRTGRSADADAGS